MQISTHNESNRRSGFERVGPARQREVKTASLPEVSVRSHGIFLRHRDGLMTKAPSSILQVLLLAYEDVSVNECVLANMYK